MKRALAFQSVFAIWQYSVDAQTPIPRSKLSPHPAPSGAAIQAGAGSLSNEDIPQCTAREGTEEGA